MKKVYARKKTAHKRVKVKEEPGHLDVKKTLLALIKNSTGTKLFRNLYMHINDVPVDVLRNGDLSCAWYVSILLLPMHLIRDAHTTVDGTVKDLLSNGWYEIKEPRIGAVLVWGPKTFKESGETHKHIGFYVGDKQAISTSDKKLSPQKHAYDIYNGRGIERMLWHPSLEK